jgi:hypothetical protein
MDENVAQKESEFSHPGHTVNVSYLGFLGFAGQIPWALILVHLPMLEPVVGGKVFSFAVGISMGIACNIVRMCVFLYGRNFTFSSRIIFGSIMSAMFTFGYFIIFACIDPTVLGEVSATDQAGFWVGLSLALLGGAGNAQLLSTGYGIASIVSTRKPMANNVFFLGQAAAAATCWPLKHVISSLTPNHTLHLGITMGFISLVSLSVIPVFHYRIQSRLYWKPISEGTNLSKCKNITRIMQQTIFPTCILWISFVATNLVTPGQVMRWGPSLTDSTSSIMTDEKLYLSLCVYMHLVADAFGKTLCVILASNQARYMRMLKSSFMKPFLVSLILARMGLLPLFYLPPQSDWGRFLLLSVFGLLHGIAVSFALSLGSSRVTAADSDLAGYLSSFSIINGLLVGSIAGIVVRLIT